jgi:hypothetical protein
LEQQRKKRKGTEVKWIVGTTKEEKKGNGSEMERKWNGLLEQQRKKRKGTEVKFNLSEMERKWNGTEVKWIVGTTKEEKKGNGSEMEQTKTIKK